MARSMRILLLADTHLGFDLPLRPRVEKARRGPDFFRNYERALEPAARGEVDLVVHGGDLLYRSKVTADLVNAAFAPLRDIADTGLPVIVVPGNHERSNIPFPLLAAHPNLHVMDRARTVRLEIGGLTVALSGFPCLRDGVRDRLGAELERTGWNSEPVAEVRLLCLHQTFEGARVGPVGYTFRGGPDVVRATDLPAGFAAVLCGHIHRHQVLSRDLSGRRLAAPVFYPGSIERTSAAERDEAKGYLLLEVAAGGEAGGRVVSWRFHDLPTRPMVDLDLDPRGLDSAALTDLLRASLEEVEPTAVVRVRLAAPPDAGAEPCLRAEAVRRLAPRSMVVSVRWPRESRDQATKRSPR